MAVMNITFGSLCLYRFADFTAIVPIESVGISGVKKEKTDKFRTLYLLHGLGGNHRDWLQASRIREIAEKYNLAVILPSGDNSFYVDGSTIGSKYGSFVGKELVEFTRELLPLSDKKEDTYVGGLSMGGFGAVHTALMYPETFSKVFAFSSAFVLDRIPQLKPGETDGILDFESYTKIFGNLDELENSPHNPKELIRQIRANGKMIPEMFLACGTEDFLLKENREFKRYLDWQKIPVRYIEDQGNHNFDFWNRYLEQAVQWLVE